MKKFPQAKMNLLKIWYTEFVIKNKLKKLLNELGGFNFVTNLVSKLEIENDDEINYGTSRSKAQ